MAETRERVNAAAEEATTRPRLTTTAEVVAPLAPYHPDRVAARAATPTLDEEARRAAFGGALPEADTKPTARTLAGHINAPWPTSWRAARS